MTAYPLVVGTFRTPRGTPVAMVYREGTNDWNTLTACLTEDEYNLRDRTLSGVAADIGAYIGGVAVGLAVDNPAVRVVAIEPVPGNAELTRLNVERNGIADRVTVIEGAVGDGTRQSVFYGYRGNEAAEHHAFVGNSTLAYDHGGMLPHETVEYDTLTLGGLLAEYGPLDLVKIDTEGAEWAFLGVATDDQRRGVETILGEWHPVRGHIQSDISDVLGLTHRVAFSGPVEGPGGFLAVRR